MDRVVEPLTRMVPDRERDYGAFVIACYSDPGIHSLREITKKPVLRIAECGIPTGLTIGQRFGVIAMLHIAIPRHLRYIGALGVANRMAAERPVELDVTELSDENRTFTRL